MATPTLHNPESQLRLCEGARVMLTNNRWVTAGLVNGALGYVRGFMFPRNFDPSHPSTARSVPLCVFVEFDDVDLPKDADGERLQFFPGRPGRKNWIPVYRSTPVAVESDGEFTRA